jgi:S1-C subfamily serine protease
VISFRAAPSDTIPAPAVRDADSTRREWLIIVTRRPDGGVLSMTALSGGRLAVRCGERGLREYVTGLDLRPEFAGGGVFGIDGQLLGIVARCADRQIAIPTSDVVRLLADDGPAERLRAAYGLELTPLDDRSRAYFRSDSGLLVVSVRRGSVADLAGLRVGDVIVAIDSLPASALGPADVMRQATSRDTLRVRRRREGSLGTVALVANERSATRPSTTFGIEVADPRPPGALITTVRQGSAARSAGIREGDRMLRVGNIAVTSRAAAQRLLAAAGGKPMFIVFERDSVERGVFIPQ